MRIMENKLCKIEGCNKKVFGLKLCNMHYSRQRNGITDMRPGPLPIKGWGWTDDDPRLRKNKDLKCSITNCTNEYYAKDFCRMHYYLNKKYGTPFYKRVYKKDIPKPICKAPNCNRISVTKGFCGTHYNRSRKGIDINRPIGNIGELNHMWNGGIFEYPNHYEMKKNRLIVLENANWICHYCGGKADRVHHRDKSKDNHSLKNLRASCAKCNSQKQDIENRRYYIQRYGISSAKIMNSLELSKSEVNMMYDNGYLKNVLKLHKLL